MFLSSASIKIGRHHDSAGLCWPGLGWAGLGWAGLGWAGLGGAGLVWAGLAWAGLACAGLGWAGPGLGRAGLGLAGVGWAGMGQAGTLPCQQVRPRQGTRCKKQSAKKRRASRARDDEQIRTRKADRAKGHLAESGLQKRGAPRALETRNARPATGGGPVEWQLRYLGRRPRTQYICIYIYIYIYI